MLSIPSKFRIRKRLVGMEPVTDNFLRGKSQSDFQRIGGGYPVYRPQFFTKFQLLYAVRVRKAL
jgi:hypothetical protein